MQQVFPEGFVFTHALYGLTWCELALKNSDDSTTVTRALAEARYAYHQIDSDYAKSIFSPALQPEYGIYYRGWKNYLLAKILACQAVKDSNETVVFNRNCFEIAQAVKRSSTPYLESYPNSSWPADAFLAIASLQIHDELLTPQYRPVIQHWINGVKSNLDPKTGLIPHAAHSTSGNSIEGARGSSISLMLRLLVEIDPEFAQQQFGVYVDKFQLTRFGLPAIREYPKGIAGLGDIDSGPVILSIGFSGSIVAIGTLNIFGEHETANLLSNTIEAFGFATSSGEKKQFIFGQLPIADAFISWSRISNPNKVIADSKGTNSHSFGSKVRFHSYSLLIIVALFLILFGKKLTGHSQHFER